MKSKLRFIGGHILDIDSLEIAEQLLSRAHNVNTRKGFPSRIGSSRAAYTVDDNAAPNDPWHLLNLNLNTFNWWMLYGADSIFAVEGTNFYDITLTDMQSVTNPYEWSSTLLNGLPVFSNGKDGLMYWDGQGANTAEIVPDWPAATSAKFVVAFRYHLFALNIDGPSGVFDNLIMWSDAAEPGTLPQSWTPGADNEAGSAFFADTPGRAICGRALNSQLLIYKPTSVAAIEYVGQQPDNIFTVRPITRSLGTLGPNCVLDLGMQHLTVGNDDVVLHDGVNTKSIADSRIKLYLANSIDETYAQNSFAIRDLNKREVWICVPEAGSQFATVAHVWDERRDAWTTRDLQQARYGTTGFVTDSTIDATWDADSEPWDSDTSNWNQGSVGSISRVVLALEDLLDVQDSDQQSTIVSTLLKQDLVLGDDTQTKLVQSVSFAGVGLGFANLQFRLGARNSTHDPISWGAFKTMNTSGHATDYEISGRYISLEIEIESDNDWTLNRVIIESRPNGNY